MYRRFIIALMLCLFIAMSQTSVFAARDGKKGPDKKAYEHASDRAKFKRTEEVKDKDAEKAEKEEKKAERERIRAEKRAEKEARKAEKKAEKEGSEEDIEEAEE